MFDFFLYLFFFRLINSNILTIRDPMDPPFAWGLCYQSYFFYLFVSLLPLVFNIVCVFSFPLCCPATDKQRHYLLLYHTSVCPPVFSGVRVTRSLVLCVCFVDRCLSFCIILCWPLCSLFFFDIRILITSLVSSNFWPLCCLFFFDIRILITSLVSSYSSYRMIM